MPQSAIACSFLLSCKSGAGQRWLPCFAGPKMPKKCINRYLSLKLVMADLCAFGIGQVDVRDGFPTDTFSFLDKVKQFVHIRTVFQASGHVFCHFFD